MNRKIAISLIFACAFSFLIAFLSSEKKYYILGKEKIEITYKQYEDYKNKNNIFILKEQHFDTTFILISFLGGFGIGYLFSDNIEKFT